MSPTLASALATLLFGLSAFLIFQQLGSELQQRWKALAPATVAILLQALALGNLIIQPQGLNLGFFPAFALIAWLISIQILLSSIHRRIESLGIIVFPISGLAGIMASLRERSDIPEHTQELPPFRYTFRKVTCELLPE